MKNLLLLLILSCLLINIHSQEVITDSKGDFIFGVPSTTVQPTLSSNNVGVLTPVSHFYRKIYYVVDENSLDTINTMAKSKLIFAKFNVVDNSKSQLKFNSKINISPSMEFGIAWGFDSLINPSAWGGTYFTYSLSVFASYQNFSFYDSVAKVFSSEKTNRISPGIKGNITMFKGTLFALSGSATYQNSIITENLTSYQLRSNTFYFDANIASNGQNEGFLSPLKSTNNLRLSLSFPQFWLSGSWNNFLPFAVTPYYFGIYSSVIKPNHNAGIILSFIGKRFRKFDRKDSGDFDSEARYKFAQALNIGYNFISTERAEQKYFFVSGTFDLNTFKPKKDLPRDSKSQIK